MLVGHEPFVTHQLDLSVHQMRRRWPVASDWYADLVRYILHVTTTHVDVAKGFAERGRWDDILFGQFIAYAVLKRRDSFAYPELLDLAHTIQAMWPDYGPVRESIRTVEAGMAQWAEGVTRIFAAYGLFVRPGVTMGEVLWTFHAVATTEEQRALSRRVSPLFSQVGPDSPGGPDYPYAARATMLALAGALVDAEGRSVPVVDLYTRRVGSD